MANVIKAKTTQEMLNDLQENLKYYRSPKGAKMTKEELKSRNEEFKRISETLSFYEISLLYYLRNSKLGSIFGFMEVAKKLYEASRELEKIKDRL